MTITCLRDLYSRKTAVVTFPEGTKIEHLVYNDLSGVPNHEWHKHTEYGVFVNGHLYDIAQEEYDRLRLILEPVEPQ